MFWKKKENKKPEFKCSKCGEVHDELPSLAFARPYHYDILSEDDKNAMAEASDDFCIIRHPDQTDRFIRVTMSIPIHDTCEDLCYGIWVSLSEKSFDDYATNFKTDTEEKTYFGTICNEIPDYLKSTLGLHVNVTTRLGGIRPEITPHENDHPLVIEWKHGISLKDALQRVERTARK